MTNLDRETQRAKRIGDLGAAFIVAGILGAFLGIPQYHLANRDKDQDRKRDLKLSLNLQHNLRGADLAHQDLRDVRLQGKVLTNADLEDADLTGANLQGTDLRGAYLKDADLRGADLRDADLTGANLRNADLRGKGGKDVSLKNADLTRASLRGAHLQKAAVNSADLTDACLSEADLRGASFGGANLTGAVLTDADVQGTRFEDDLRPALLNGAGLKGVNYDRHPSTPDDKTVWPLKFQEERAIHGEPRTRPAPAIRAPRRLVKARVVEVVDGDTIRVSTGDSDRSKLPAPGRTRLAGVNAPDPDDPDEAGVKARAFVQRELRKHGNRVGVEVTSRRTDGGRYLVNLWLTPTMTLNEKLVQAGRALAQRQRSPLKAPLMSAELRAKQRGAGMWQTCPDSGN